MADLKLTVHAGPHRRVHCPVSVVVDAPSRVSQVTLQGENDPVPAQANKVEGGLCVNWIVEDLAAGASSDYRLSLGGRSSSKKSVQLIQKRNRIQIDVNGAHFTTYCYGASLVRPHLYPVIGPYGDRITRRMATPKDGRKMDHHHHRSVWIAHGEVNGFNNWGEGGSAARTIHKEFDALEDGPVLGRIVAISTWTGRAVWDGDYRTHELVEERAEWTVYNTPANARIMDLHLTLTSLKEDVLFGDTKEGGLASLRVEDSMRVSAGEGGQIENAQGGANEDETWGKQSVWCDYSGPVKGKRVGATIMDHPDSFRHPTYWHVRNYGLMTANPFGLSYYTGDINKRAPHVLSPGQTLTGIYRYFIHSGDATEGNVSERYHDFANPPKVEIVK